MDIYFMSANENKIKEVVTILECDNIKVLSENRKIQEIQSENMAEIVTHKVRKAFMEIGRPVLVEQTGLLMKDLDGFPGGLTQIFWDSLKADKFCDYFSSKGSSEVIAKTVLGYCDGKQIKIFDGEIEGTIVTKPRGDRTFQWDCVFQPKGYDKTFAELGDKKNEISMRKIALEKLKKYLEG